MADIELVIKIPEEVYKAYKMNPTLCMLNADQENIAKSYLINGLTNGTPLPKEHGDLIDVNIANDIARETKTDEDARIIKKFLNTLKPIIEVDITKRRNKECLNLCMQRK